MAPELKIMKIFHSDPTVLLFLPLFLFPHFPLLDNTTGPCPSEPSQLFTWAVGGRAGHWNLWVIIITGDALLSYNYSQE